MRQSDHEYADLYDSASFEAKKMKPAYPQDRRLSWISNSCGLQL